MALAMSTTHTESARPFITGNESSYSAVSWAAIFSGALIAIATALVLVSLTAGLGLTSISAWPNVGASATTFTIGTGIGLIVVQWISSGVGGYITGRLRTKWWGCTPTRCSSVTLLMVSFRGPWELLWYGVSGFGGIVRDRRRSSRRGYSGRRFGTGCRASRCVQRVAL